MTEEQINQYLNDYDRQNRLTAEQEERLPDCPFCGSSDWGGKCIEIDGDQAMQVFYCMNEDCRESWIDVYQLVTTLRYS